MADAPEANASSPKRPSADGGPILTFLAALRCNGLTAPCVIDGPINGLSFRAYVEQVLVPILAPGDIVVMDNLGSHKGLRHSRSDPRSQSQAVLPARLLARPQSNRTGLRQNEDFAAQGRRANKRTDLANHRRAAARLLHPDRMRKLLHQRRIRFSLTRSRSKRHCALDASRLAQMRCCRLPLALGRDKWTGDEFEFVMHCLLTAD